ncbi:MAG: succinate dehydrogenase, cytochrome b556 subunit [Paracoccus sp. (in: a-proteobacteria)]|uniref:succinate dehydrogenase, cytochrome b556 subunit n=1 Tax=Paracoccus sp. TaxID=267 RepID=UPI0026DFCD52|nr:succinate dehydrogenase, cytochrome b556 subunit [Paracoccus sp. (in: a-proteobacteria)]MDO5621525.1 succinate dehydrogenase, cytochrome b556 subunit [Paracoccus sp. (in: a-proteobacteria)]
MADVNRGNRPLSPHLQVYRLPLTAITSILTRATGHALLAGVVLFVWWLVAAATSDRAFACADAVVHSWFGFLVIWGSVWSLWYHFAAGIRHLIYDAGHGLEIDTAHKMAIGVIAASVVLTLLTMIFYYFG